VIAEITDVMEDGILPVLNMQEIMVYFMINTTLIQPKRENANKKA